MEKLLFKFDLSSVPDQFRSQAAVDINMAVKHEKDEGKREAYIRGMLFAYERVKNGVPDAERIVTRGSKCIFCGVEIKQHPAARCLDANVAEVVMGWSSTGTWTLEEPEQDDWFGVQPGAMDDFRAGKTKTTITPVEYYSTDIGVAWKVLQQVAKLPGYRCGELGLDDKSVYFCSLVFGEDVIKASAETPELAICRAAMMCHQKD